MSASQRDFSAICADRVARAYAGVREMLLGARHSAGHWVGELSSSALSTATAIMALRTAGDSVLESPAGVPIDELVNRGLDWLGSHQNSDGGWGDTVKSLSNISTTMLARSAFECRRRANRDGETCAAADRYIERIGGLDAVVARYGKDKTFSVPILTHCALAGKADWKQIPALPFELAWLPARFYKAVRLPVVSYALPALIAIGQVRFFKGPPSNPLLRLLRRMALEPTLRTLERIQPEGGGFLEATPLTSFVTMSLAGMGRGDHPIVRRGVEFLVRSVRPDGSWPIDTNLSTWLTTLSINALEEDFPKFQRDAVRRWLLNQQYCTVHPYTNADPGGWAWTDLPGGVPDADDTPGAILALLNLRNHDAGVGTGFEEDAALARAVRWLLDLQNRDGGWPTFCRGWGTLPFDRSAPDLTAHALRALSAWKNRVADDTTSWRIRRAVDRAIRGGLGYLTRTQRPDGAWLPLWFGCQHARDDENPTYGTSRVLAAYRDLGMSMSDQAMRARLFLQKSQNEDGGWGGCQGTSSTIEETSLAAEALLKADREDRAGWRGIDWLIAKIERCSDLEPAPIGFYFAKLWYFEPLYPQIFATAALRCADRLMKPALRSAPCPSHR